MTGRVKSGPFLTDKAFHQQFTAHHRIFDGKSKRWSDIQKHIGLNRDSRVAIIPRGFAFQGLTQDGLNGRKWQAKYGVLALDMLKKDPLAEGINEKGFVGAFTIGFTPIVPNVIYSWLTK